MGFDTSRGHVRRKRQQGNDSPSEWTMNPGRYAVCKGCRLRIRPEQPRVWSSNPGRLGLHHDNLRCLAGAP